MLCARCVHRTPRRMRLRFGELKGNEPLLARLADRLAQCPAVESVTTNSASGSMLVHHQVSGGGELFRFIREKRLFLIADSGGASLADATVSAYREVDKRVMRLTGGGMNVADAVSLTLAATGVYHIVRGKFAAPAWYTAFWYALNIFLKSHKMKEGEISSRGEV